MQKGQLKYTKDEFVKLCNIAHNCKYNYEFNNYSGLTKPIHVFCPIHGFFDQLAYLHLNGTGCPRCSAIKANESYKVTTLEFIERAIAVHQDKYDYSETEYINNKTKVKIVCPEHGDFYIYPQKHYEGRGCKKCSAKVLSEKTRKSKEQYIIDAVAIHNNKYQYDLQNYENCRSKINIICLEHGIFEMRASAHLMGQGCPICNKPKNIFYTKNIFCEKYEYATLYIATFKNNNEEFIKIGITGKSIKERCYGFPAEYNVNIILEHYDTSRIVWDIETELHKKFNEKTHNPTIKFGGYTECFDICILQDAYNEALVILEGLTKLQLA